ncbi:hypothetical protein NX059_000629 [Plenodomus lindquistii]|nr:hypothetical protein NX059_000629 [Plenodomus lindquistii]
MGTQSDPDESIQALVLPQSDWLQYGKWAPVWNSALVAQDNTIQFQPSTYWTDLAILFWLDVLSDDAEPGNNAINPLEFGVPDPILQPHVPPNFYLDEDGPGLYSLASNLKAQYSEEMI